MIQVDLGASMLTASLPAPAEADPRFWKVVHHFVSKNASKMWRANAEFFIKRLLPPSFDIYAIQGEPLHLFELALLLEALNISCKKFLNEKSLEFVQAGLDDGTVLSKSVAYSLAILKRLSERLTDPEIPLDLLLEWCAACYNTAPIFQPLAISAWSCQKSRRNFLTDFLAPELVPFYARTRPSSDSVVLSPAVVEICFEHDNRIYISKCLEYGLCLRDNGKCLNPVVRTWYFIMMDSKTFNVTDDLVGMKMHIDRLLYCLGVLPEWAGLTPELEQCMTSKNKERIALAELGFLNKISFRLRPELKNLQSYLNEHTQNVSLWAWILNRPEIARLFLHICINVSSLLASTNLGENPLFWALAVEENLRVEPAWAWRHPDIYDAVKFAWRSCQFNYRTYSKLKQKLRFDVIARHIEPSWMVSKDARIYLNRHALCFEQDANLRLAAVFAKAGIKLSAKGRENILQFIADNPELPQTVEYARLLVDKLNGPRELLVLVYGEPMSYEDALQADYETLMEPLEHDHDHVVGYASCCAECYCD